MQIWESEPHISVELHELFLRFGGGEGEVAGVEDRLLPLAAEDIAQEFLHLRCERFARLAIQADVHLARERIAAARGVLSVALVVGAGVLARAGARLQSGTASFEA